MSADTDMLYFTCDESDIFH